MKPPSPYGIGPALDDPALAASDARAGDDLLAGRVVTHEAVMIWLDSWDQGRGSFLPSDPVDSPALTTAAIAGPRVATIWTEAAVADCEGARRYLGAVARAAERRFADAIVTAVNSLASSLAGDGEPLRPGIGSRTLLHPFLLRIQVDPDRLAILGIHLDSASRIL